MDQVKKKMSEEMKKMVEKAFKKALEIADAFEKQEDLKNRTAKLPQNSQQFRGPRRKQLELIEELGRTSDDLMELGRNSFAVTPQMAQRLGDAMKKMNES